MPPARRTPRPRRYARTDSAVCDYYCPLTGVRRTATLGPWGSPEADAAFRRLLADLAAKRPPADASGRRPSHAHLTLAQLALAYLTHAHAYYRRADGTATDEARSIKCALRFALSGGRSARPAADFSLSDLKDARAEMVAAGHARPTANANAGRVTRMFRWAANETPPLAPPAVAGELATLTPLAKFRTAAREPAGVRPAPTRDVARALRHLSPVVAAMVRFAWRTGCRPQDVCGLTPGQITARPDGVLEVRPARHKCAWRGHERVFYAPPRAARDLTPWLAGMGPGEAAFPPSAAREFESATRRAARKTPLYASHAARYEAEKRHRPRRQTRGFYSVAAFGRAVRRACERAGVEPWAPNRLRHAAGTRWRRLHGAEAASVLLGHRSLQTTEIYAEADRDGAARALLGGGG